ncbi:MAG TPA: cysteine dioxygenase family protein [Rhodanobacteraceae bacterium]|nr:cysteine dioxygenase family protein [Rhodanobacteraceae bacterium]
MLALDFPGRDRLVAAIDQAVSRTDRNAIAEALRDALCRLIRERSVQLPTCVFDPVEDHYARREIYRSEEHGYDVIAMTWGPGQGTAVHDHAGMWCVEGVWAGQLEVTPYELIEERDQRYHFERRGTMQAGPGSAGSLIPPHDYHTIRNPSADDIAVSLHIYSGTMTSCAMFKPIEGQDAWYARKVCELSLDRAR